MTQWSFNPRTSGWRWHGWRTWTRWVTTRPSPKGRPVGDRKFVARITAYQCPSHPNFRALILSSVDGDGGIRYASGKCCPAQYAVETGTWRLTRPEANEFREHLDRLIEDSDRAIAALEGK